MIKSIVRKREIKDYLYPKLMQHKSSNAIALFFSSYNAICLLTETQSLRPSLLSVESFEPLLDHWTDFTSELILRND